jgi:cell division protein FtsN
MLPTTTMLIEKPQSPVKKLLIGFAFMAAIAAFIVLIVWVAMYISTANAKPHSQICEVWLYAKPKETIVYEGQTHD